MTGPSQNRLLTANYLSQIILCISCLFFPDLFTSRQCRSSADIRILRIPQVRTKTFGKRCFFCCAPKQWNSLPSDISHIQSSYAFKTALKFTSTNNTITSHFKLCFLTCPPTHPHPPPVAHLPSLALRYIPSVQLRAHARGCMYAHVCVCVCVCEWERDRQTYRDRQIMTIWWLFLRF